MSDKNHFDKEQLEAELKDRVFEQFNHESAFDEFIVPMLQNFAYRYFDYENEKQLKLNQSEKFLWIECRQDEWGKCLRAKNVNVLECLKEAARQNPRGEGAKVTYMIGVEKTDNLDNGGEIKSFVSVSWDAPEFVLNSQNQYKIEKSFSFDSSFSFRNQFPKFLDDLCEVFE